MLVQKNMIQNQILQISIQLGMEKNEDRIRISIHETDSRSFDYSLSINERPFEQIYAQWPVL